MVQSTKDFETVCKIILLAILKDSTQIIGRPEEARRGEALVWFERPEDYHHSPHLKASVENLSGTRVSIQLLTRKEAACYERVLDVDSAGEIPNC